MADMVGSDDGERSLLLIQINYLEEQLKRCQLKCDELEKQNEDLTSQYSILEKDKRDSTEYLKQSLLQKENKKKELRDCLESQQQAAKQSIDALKLQHSQDIQELQQQVDELKPASLVQEAKREKCEEQKEQLLQLQSDIESLKKQLTCQEKEYEAAIHRQKLETKLEWERIDDDTAFETTYFLQQERNVHQEHLDHLKFLSKENMTMSEDLDTLRDTVKCLEAKSELLYEAVCKITKEKSTNLADLKQLKKMLQMLTAKLKDYSITKDHTPVKNEKLRKQLASVSKRCCLKTAEVTQLGLKVQRERKRMRELQGVMCEAVTILKHILTDSGEVCDSEWKMKRLLDILESTAPTTTLSWTSLKDFTKKNSPGSNPLNTAPKPAREQGQSFVASQ